MQETKGLLDSLKQHDKLTIKVSSNANHVLPADVLQKLSRPHRTAYYFFVFVEKGTSTHKIDWQDVTVSAGQLLFVLPNQIHTPPPQKSHLEYFKLSFDENCLASLRQPFPFLINPLNTPTITFDHPSKKRVKTIFGTLNDLLHSDKKQKDAAVILAHLNTLLTEINHAYFKNISPKNISNSGFSKYIEFKLLVETHLAEQHAVNIIAEKLAVTTNHLYGIVKAFSGVSPKEFMTNRLMLEAQRKLHYSNPSVKELAYELGFNDPDYFSRLFKKSTGKSVSRYLADLQDSSGK